MEKGIKYLRELAVREVIYSDWQVTINPDEMPCQRPLLKKFVQSAPSVYSHTLSTMVWGGSDTDIPTVNEVADRVQQYEDSLSRPIGVAAIENLTKKVAEQTEKMAEQNKTQTETIESITKTQTEAIENISKTQTKTMGETMEKMTKAIVEQNETIFHKLLEKLSEIGRESYSSPAQTQVAAQAQIPAQTQVTAQAQIPAQTKVAAKTKVTAIKKKRPPMRPTKGKQDSFRSFLWLCLCDNGEDMRRWDKKPTSALQS
ncbi:ubiquitin carboxyl-terminal hydrolase 4 [Limosa lapponica baueri]|uniref:Ubiquitin carboxyl-terminal hydrolase 4 n=1 Tax=Limosa lapponica baueri TaxID=1758121 RepID=A0A2I0UDP3_LIMLA|nr:ubiquitin carboxyl-terminal hydrolase 4 [Limosa lapponica baueri]